MAYARFASVVLGLVLSTVAQEGMQQQPSAAQPKKSPRLYTIAVTVQSNDPRVRGISPRLKQEAAAVVEKSADNVRAIMVSGTKNEAMEQARKNNADYLLSIEFSPQSTASIAIGPGSRNPGDSEVFGSERANMQGRMFLAWTVDPIGDNKAKLHDSRYVQPSEYPMGPNFDWVSQIASRSVRDAAAAAMSKLKMKKGLGLELEIQQTRERSH